MDSGWPASWQISGLTIAHIARTILMRFTLPSVLRGNYTPQFSLLGRLDRVDKNHSALLERAALACRAQLERQARDRKDVEIIGRNAERLNREAMDRLEYQLLR